MAWGFAPYNPHKREVSSSLLTPFRWGDSPQTPTWVSDPLPQDPLRLETLRPPRPPDQGEPWTSLN